MRFSLYSCAQETEFYHFMYVFLSTFGSLLVFFMFEVQRSEQYLRQKIPRNYLTIGAVLQIGIRDKRKTQKGQETNTLNETYNRPPYILATGSANKTWWSKVVSYIHK